jgi:hypothetical protein
MIEKLKRYTKANTNRTRELAKIEKNKKTYTKTKTKKTGYSKRQDKAPFHFEPHRCGLQMP